MGTNKMDPRRQFSKWLARWTAVFWFIFIAWFSAIMLIQPAAAIYAVYMAIIVTVVMILNVISYTQNSTTEKIALAMLDRTRLQLSIGKSPDQADTADEEGGDNG